MQTMNLSTCFCTNDIDACRTFYVEHFHAKPIFDCGWYLNLTIGDTGHSIQFMKPQGQMPTFGGVGITLNFQVDDVDEQHTRLVDAGLEPAMPLEDHPWGDRGFSVMVPIGNSVYIYSTREPTDEFGITPTANKSLWSVVTQDNKSLKRTIYIHDQMPLNFKVVF